MKLVMKKLLFIAIALMLYLPPANATEEENGSDSATGTISGIVIDQQTRETLPGANIIIEGSTRGAAANLEGYYEITKVPPGTYTIVASMIGYANKRIIDVKVDRNKRTELSFSMSMEALMGEEIQVTAELIRETEGALLLERQKASAVSDAISAEAMSRYGSSDAADAMIRVNGASVVDGRYVLIRGLGGRYGITQLNGSEVPSSDPDRKSVNMDLIAANLLENIVAVKTATPDKPGTFTAGAVEMNTKSFPASRSFTISLSSTFNSQSSFNNNFLTYAGGKRDWLGFDDGTRAIPAALADGNVKIPNLGAAFTNAEQAQELDRLSKSFNSVMAPETGSAFFNQGYGFAYTDRFRLFGKDAGFVGNLSYSRSFNSYESGTVARWQLTGNVNSVDGLSNHYNLTDAKSSDDVLLGGLANLSVKLADKHKLSINGMYNHAGITTSRYLTGAFPRDLTQDSFYETRTLQFKERDLRSLQMQGEHGIRPLGRLQVDWKASVARSKQDEPDLRFFTNDYTVQEREGSIDTLYAIRPAIYPVPTRYFRNLEDDRVSGQIDFTLPVSRLGRDGKLKFGALYSESERSFRERRFEFRQDRARYDGSGNAFFSDENMGILEGQSSARFFRFGNYIVDATQQSSNYNGDETVSAGYAMLDAELFGTMRVIGGVRYEGTDIQVASIDTTKPGGQLDNRDWLPSINLVYPFKNETMNLRFAYSHTIARPQFRELAPFASFEFVGDYLFIGNPNLKRTLSRNYDLRWEWFMRPGEVYAISAFYKNLDLPIERAINPRAQNGEIQFRNVDNAIIYGLEFEVRKNLDAFIPALDKFQVGANLSLIQSSVQIDPEELLAKRALDPEASDRRSLQGQSDFVLNTSLIYNNFNSGTVGTLAYNLVGERLAEVSLGGSPDVYEQPRHLLDFSLSQQITGALRLKFAAKNLLNAKVSRTQALNSVQYPVYEYLIGREFSLGVSYAVSN